MENSEWIPRKKQRMRNFPRKRRNDLNDVSRKAIRSKGYSDEGVKNVNAYEAEKAFREQLECETVHTDINTMETRKLGAPVGLELERHESQVVLTFLVFKTGVKSVSRYSCEKVAVSARDASPKDEEERQAEPYGRTHEKTPTLLQVGGGSIVSTAPVSARDAKCEVRSECGKSQGRFSSNISHFAF